MLKKCMEIPRSYFRLQDVDTLPDNFYGYTEKLKALLKGETDALEFSHLFFRSGVSAYSIYHELKQLIQPETPANNQILESRDLGIIYF